uniref:Uncharacterized protein n=1 Tax=viral metagenome TaxID=1070528 RepID=A0A6C0AVC4_9ZZZZ|tara:strand:+ start:104 stop:715 length:612 start_codon:yes stop_codon:yes gene_type:complete
MEKNVFTKLILNSINSPFNIHILNLVNTINSISSDNRIHETLELFSIQNIFNRNIATFLKNVDLSESVLESDSFLSISSALDTIFDNILLSKSLHENLRILINNLKNILNALRKVANTKELEKQFEVLEDSLGYIEENTIKKSINNLVNDEKYADLLWNSIINFSSSLYGILAALTPNSKWEDVIVDKDKFNSFIKELSTSNK